MQGEVGCAVALPGHPGAAGCPADAKTLDWELQENIARGTDPTAGTTNCVAEVVNTA